MIPFELGGFSSGRGFRTHPAIELFVDGDPMTLARWPNEGFVKTGKVPGPLTLTAWDRRPGTPEGRFQFEGDRPARWLDEPDAWLYGYWFWDWADSYEKIERIDPEQREITLAKPWHGYGYREGQRYHAVNLLSELDAPGEWYLDRTRNHIYLFPKATLNDAVIEISVAAFPLLEIEAASHLRFQGLLWECGAADGVRILGGEDVRLEGCTIRKMAGNGVEIRGWPSGMPFNPATFTPWAAAALSWPGAIAKRSPRVSTWLRTVTFIISRASITPTRRACGWTVWAIVSDTISSIMWRAARCGSRATIISSN